MSSFLLNNSLLHFFCYSSRRPLLTSLASPYHIHPMILLFYTDVVIYWGKSASKEFCKHIPPAAIVFAKFQGREKDIYVDSSADLLMALL